MQTTSYDIKYHQTEYLSCYPQVIESINYRAEVDGTIILPKKRVKYKNLKTKQFKVQKMTHLDYLVCKMILLLGGEFRGGTEGCRMLAEKLGSTVESMRKVLQKLQKIQLNSYEPIPLLEKIEKHKSKDFAERFGYQAQNCKYRLSTWFLQEEARHEGMYKTYIQGKSTYSPVTCVQYIPHIAQELGLTLKEYFLLFMHQVRYRDGQGCYNKSDWARATGVCRGLIYKVLNKFKSKNLIGHFVLGRKGSHRENSEFWIQLTQVFQGKIDAFFGKKKDKKPVEKQEISPPTVKTPNPQEPPNPLGKEASEVIQAEDLMNLESDIPNLPFYSESVIHLELIEKWKTGLYAFFEHDDYTWKHEFPKLRGIYQVLDEIPLLKLKLLDVRKTLEIVFEQTKDKLSPDSPLFMSRFRSNLQKTLEKYQE